MNGYSDTDITPQEMQRLSEALKNEEFKSMFLDYVKEISDPENRKLYEAELTALEAEQGRDLTFVNPEPDFCVKTTDGLGLKVLYITNAQVFINICSSDAINEAVAKKAGNGSHWSIPYSLGNPRDDLDAGQKNCKVYDVVFHSKTLARCTSDARFKDLIVSSAIEGIEKQFKTTLDKKYKLPKLKVKGVIPSTVIRVKKSDLKEDTSTKAETSSEFLTKILENQIKVQDPKNAKREDLKPESKVPEYTIVHQGVISDYTDFTNAREKSGTRPDVLLVKVKLPKIESISQIELDTFEKCVELIVPGIYEVQIPLPFSVIHDKGTAKFDKTTKELSVSLPVIKPVLPKPDKLLIEELEDDEPDVLAIDGDKGLQEPQKSDDPSVANDPCDYAPIESSHGDGIKQQKVPIFHMRQNISTVSFMIPQHIKKDDTKIQFLENSILFDFLHGTESYRLHIEFQDSIMTASSKLVIEDSYTLIEVNKEAHIDWDYVTIYSGGKSYQRRFSKIMSEAENELWSNPSELLKKPVCSPNSAKDDIASQSPLKDNETAQIPATTEIIDFNIIDHLVDDNENRISEVISPPKRSIDETPAENQQHSELTTVQPASVNEKFDENHSKIIKNSYLFELDD